MAHPCEMGQLLFSIFSFLSWLRAFSRIPPYVWHAFPASLVIKDLPFLQGSAKHRLCPKVFLDFPVRDIHSPWPSSASWGLDAQPDSLNSL